MPGKANAALAFLSSSHGSGTQQQNDAATENAEGFHESGIVAVVDDHEILRESVIEPPDRRYKMMRSLPSERRGE